MAKRRRPDFDMFDVASGKVSLDDYLNQRYSEVDLQSNVWVDPNDQVDELLAPPSKDEPPVVRPVHPPPEPSPEAQEQEHEEKQEQEPSDAPLDFEALVSQFHEAASDYKDRNPEITE